VNGSGEYQLLGNQRKEVGLCIKCIRANRRHAICLLSVEFDQVPSRAQDTALQKHEDDFSWEVAA
jgi:hypothetical protein